MKEKTSNRADVEAVHTHTHTHTLSLLKNKKEQRGITLIALVVTIVILLILAGITLIYVLGDNGILKAAQEAKNQTEAAMRNEQQSLAELANMLKEEYGGGNGDNNEGGNTENPNPDTPVVDVPIEDIKTNWEEIEKIAGEIAKDESITSESEEATVTVDGNRYTIKPGDIFEVQYDGETRRVRVLGFKHDDLVNTGVYGGNHSKASISFEFLDFMTGTTYKSMNGSNTNSGGWAATQMRKDLNGYSNNNAAQSGAIGGLGANLSNKAYIKQVTKKYIGTYNSASSVATCNDYLWLLAASEVVNAGYQAGAYGYAITSEGTQYKYYQGVTDAWNSSSTGRQKRPSESGSTYHWWIRSPGYSSDTFCRIDSNGNTNTHANASNGFGVAPGFSI